MNKGGKLRPYEPTLMSLRRLFDAMMGAGLFSGLAWYFGMYKALGQIHLLMAVLIFLIALGCFDMAGVYRSWRTGLVLDEIRHLVSACSLVYVGLFVIVYFMKVSSDLSRTVVAVWMITWPLLLVGERIVIRNFLKHQRRKGRNIRTCVIAGAGDLGIRLARWIENNPWSGNKVIGFFDDETTKVVEGYPVLDNLDAIPQYIQEHPVDIVYLTLPMRAESKIQELVATLADSTVSIYLVPDIFYFDLILGGSATFYDDLPVIALRDTPLRGFNACLKRAEDLILTSLMLLAAWPVMLVIAIAVKLSSPGPVFFKQWRYGLHGKPIVVYKFRTMTVCEDGYQFRQATEDDPRTTRLGALLRKTSLDELPQLINILQGRMSLVGPRPHPVAMNEAYRKLVPGYMLRHKVRPGLTGLAQINGFRGETQELEKMQARIDHDLKYLRQWSLFLDLKILFITVINGSWRMNAY
jgi:putative colanic acid biosynthesis UDP-glucose lipid carrier transferase